MYEEEEEGLAMLTLMLTLMLTAAAAARPILPHCLPRPSLPPRTASQTGAWAVANCAVRVVVQTLREAPFLASWTEEDREELPVLA